MRQTEILLCIFLDSLLVLISCSLYFSFFRYTVKDGEKNYLESFILLKTDSMLRKEISSKKIAYWKNFSSQQNDFFEIQKEVLEKCSKIKNIRIVEIFPVIEEKQIVGMKVLFTVELNNKSSRKTFQTCEKFSTRKI